MSTQSITETTRVMSRMHVIVHGGAGRFYPERSLNKIDPMSEAVEAAWEELVKGKPAEFAVVAALRIMEGDEHFNAGYGGYPNANGIVLQDIGLMRGSREFVSLLNVRRITYPSSVALDMMRDGRSLMSVWTHELMQQADAADEFIKERYGWVDSHDKLLSPHVLEMLARNQVEVGSSGGSHGTVGCVVCDSSGFFAAGTSTGGVNAKENGRIGDTPIVGSGVFADNEICALSTTGHGETLLLGLLSGFIVSNIRTELRKDANAFRHRPSLMEEILDQEFSELSRKAPDKGGGLIVIPRGGMPRYQCNSEMISIGYRTGTRNSVAESDSFIHLKTGEKVRRIEDLNQ